MTASYGSALWLVDRAREVQSIELLLDQARRSTGGSLVLHGEAGVGLSTLLDNAARRAGDMTVLRIAGIAGEAHAPYGALQRLLGPELWPRHRRSLPQPQRHALAQAFGVERDGGVNGLFVGLGTLGLLLREAEDRPVLCTIDDADRLDEPSAVALALVGRRLDAGRVVMLIASRDPVAEAGCFEDLNELAVDTLSETDARTLVDLVFGSRLEERARARILTETAGNPRAILELPRTLEPEPNAALAEPLPLAKDLEAYVLQPLGLLSARARDLLLLAAILVDASAALFWQAADVLGTGIDARHEVANLNLLAVGTRVSLRSGLIGSALYGAATVDRRQRIHRAIAEAASHTGETVRAAWHLAAASTPPDADVAAGLEHAADGAGDESTAAVLRERAAAFTADPSLRARRLLVTAHERFADGQAKRAAELLDELSSLPLTELDSARAGLLRARVDRRRGEGVGGAREQLNAATEVVRHDERLGREALLEAMESAIESARFGSDRQVGAAARAALAATTDEPAVGSELLLRGLALLATSGGVDAVSTLRRARTLIESEGDRRWLALAATAGLELWDDAALDVVVAADAEASGRLRFSPLRAELGYLAGVDHIISGRLDRAARKYADAYPLAASAGDSAFRRDADVGSMMVAAWRGRPAEARALIERVAREAVGSGHGRSFGLTRYALALLENSLGRYDHGLAAAEEAVEDDGLVVASFSLPELIEGAVRSRHRHVAVDALDRLAERAIASGTNWAMGTLARSRALLAQGDDAEQLYREAIERLAASRARPQLARAHLLYGEWLRRRRRRRDARGHLRRAESMFVTMGADAFAGRARSELRATGETQAARSPRGSERLTAQETRIANLVADGASNPEIGALMFISPRTVEYHLHKIFQKLGVSSRGEIARRLPTDGRGEAERAPFE